MYSTTITAGVWERAPADPQLKADEIHVWRANLHAGPDRVRELHGVLSPDELERARRFRFERDRRDFVVTRGLLRSILGLYLDESPGRVTFSYNPYGKPMLKERSWQSLHFNLSHSRGLALFAIAFEREVGVDIEYVRGEFADEEIAERFFAPGEVAALRSLPRRLQARAFFNCWARKEAYVKARGDGLSHPLDHFEVTVTPHEPAALLNDSLGGREIARWSMRELIPAPGYAAAVVFEGAAVKLCRWCWAS